MNKYWSEIILQHHPKAIKKWLDGVFDYSSVKFGDIKKGQGDIVIINLKPHYDHNISFVDYMAHTHFIDRIITEGIYTNIYWKREFFVKTTEYICGT